MPDTAPAVDHDAETPQLPQSVRPVTLSTTHGGCTSGTPAIGVGVILRAPAPP
jgi:hypothetical protein